MVKDAAEVYFYIYKTHLRPKIHGFTGCKRTGFVKPDSVKLARAIYYTMKQDLETVLYKPLCHRGFKASCAVYRVERGYSPSLCHCSSPFTWSSLQYPLFKLLQLLACTHVILHDFLWHVQYMVHGSQALGWFNPLFFEPVGTSPQPSIWLRKVGLLSSQSEPWVDATCSLKIEHAGCAENQALANHPCSVEHVLLHALVKYTIQLALQNTFSYTQYNRVVWAYWARVVR